MWLLLVLFLFNFISLGHIDFGYLYLPENSVLILRLIFYVSVQDSNPVID
jgi:hypothetical protein